MPSSRLRSLPYLLLAAGAAVLILALLLIALPVAEPMRTLLPTGLSLVLLGAAVALLRRESRACDARLAARERDVSQLRHDLRGILSPAMLTADRLTASADPVVRRECDQ